MRRLPDRDEPARLAFLRMAAGGRINGPQPPAANSVPPLAANDNIHTFRYNHVQMEMTMSLDRSVLAFAGIMVLLSVALTAWVSPLFVWLTVFVGLNLLQSAFTGFCPAAMVFRMLGVKPGCAF
jgi:Inner membrane protein YgaP-like, transmembrane domain